MAATTEGTFQKIGAARRFRWILPAVGVGLAGLLWWHPIGSWPDVRRPDVVLIVVDALRADHVGVYGYPRDTTPHLDALARGGMYLKRAYTQAFWTVPSITSLFSSQYPDVHRVDGAPTDPETRPLDEGFLTLAEAVSEHGYLTAAFTSHPWLGADLNLDQGFEEFRVVTDMFRFRGAEKLNEELFAWLDGVERLDRPFFLYVHYMGPHAPYWCPEPFAGRYREATGTERIRRLTEQMRSQKSFRPAYDTLQRLTREGDLTADEFAYLADRYDETLRYSDQAIGALLERLGRSQRRNGRFVVVTADHGEAFGEHGTLMHYGTVHTEEARVPLIFSGPKLPRATPTDAVVQLIDVYPTLLDLVGLPVPSGLAGRSLARVAESPEARFASTKGDGQYRLAAGPWVGLFLAGATEPFAIYDVEKDPFEKKMLSAGDVPEADAALSKAAVRLRDDITAQIRTLREPERKVIVDERTRERLESLGYVAGGGEEAR